ncbi:MAG: Zn-dependent hydrolase [Bacteroidetes bacterium]|nr:Zn-dependent hydrolase [Bacteroidota bacterium]
MQRILPLLLAVTAALPARAQLKPVSGFPLTQSLASYKTIRLTADVTKLKPEEAKALKLMIEATAIADRIFWKQAYGDKDSLLKLAKDPELKKYLEINYGPWDRMNNDKPFVEGVGPKPLGANFYPADMTKEEYDNLPMPDKANQYTVLQRVGDKEVRVIPYSEAYAKELWEMQLLLNKAAEILMSADPALAQFLQMRAAGLMQNEYNMSDRLWLGLKDNSIDLILGPIENYEDKLNGQKTAFEGYVLIRDKEWGAKLEKYVKYLPELQRELPVAKEYKPELPGATPPAMPAGNGEVPPMPPTDPNNPERGIEINIPPPGPPEGSIKAGNQLAVFDVVYYAGDCNAGSKTIAVNLPNDEGLQQEIGTRRSQLKNVMKAKFDNMVVPISKLLIEPKQLANITFDAFFSNVMFHEVAHGLGIKNTINGKGTVREALGAGYSAIEECKADVLGLYMVTQLYDKGELTGKLDDYYVTFVASVFRSVRFGAGNAHGSANMITFNTLLDKGAVKRQSNGFYKVDVAAMRGVIKELAGQLLMLQGDGNADGVKSLLASKAVVASPLADDLKKIEKAGVPVDLVFEQGVDVLGLK